MLEALATCLTRRDGGAFRTEIRSRPFLVRFHLGKNSFEEVVIHIADESTAEIHCHGNPLLVEHISETFRRLGFWSESWEDWIRRTETDAIAAAARIALARAPTWRVASILLDQYWGALTRAVNGIKNFVQKGEWDRAKLHLKRLLRWEKLGFHLSQPWKVAVIGPPNAGKSSILNWLLGHDRVIVDPAPGTTRDFVSATTAVEGWPVELYDTAGIRVTCHQIEREAIARTITTARQADLVLLVFDRSLPWSSEFAQLRDEWPNAVIVLNKRDLQPGPGVWCEGVTVSTYFDEDRPLLLETIARRLVLEVPPRGEAVPFTEHQIACLKKALGAVENRDPVAALAACELFERRG